MRRLPTAMIALSLVVLSGCTQEQFETLDGHWFLDYAVIGAGVYQPTEDQHIEMVIDGDTISGGGECRRFTTSILSRAGSTISIASAVVTDLQCGTETDQLEAAFIAALDRVSRAGYVDDPASELEHWLLTLTGPDTRLTFHHAYV